MTVADWVAVGLRVLVGGLSDMDSAVTLGDAELSGVGDEVELPGVNAGAPVVPQAINNIIVNKPIHRLSLHSMVTTSVTRLIPDYPG